MEIKVNQPDIFIKEHLQKKEVALIPEKLHKNLEAKLNRMWELHQKKMNTTKSTRKKKTIIADTLVIIKRYQNHRTYIYTLLGIAHIIHNTFKIEKYKIICILNQTQSNTCMCSKAYKNRTIEKSVSN